MVATRETRMHSPDRAQLSLHTACTRSFGSLELEEKIIYLAYSQPDRHSSVESSFEKSAFLSFKNETIQSVPSASRSLSIETPYKRSASGPRRVPVKRILAAPPNFCGHGRRYTRPIARVCTFIVTRRASIAITSGVYLIRREKSEKRRGVGAEYSEIITTENPGREEIIGR